MADLTEDRTDRIQAGGRMGRTQPIAAATTLYLGAIVGWDASGDLVHASASAAAKPLTFVTRGGDGNDNSAGAAGDKTAWIAERDGSARFLLETGVVSRADIGATIYGVDSNTIQLADNGKPLGELIDYVDGVAWIMVI